MTGFARSESEITLDSGLYRWTWEVRSLNSKGLDIKCRLPSWLENLETEVRKVTSASFARGAISINLQIRSTASETRVQLNEEVLAQVIEMSDVVKSKIDCTPPSIDGILSLRGVLTLEEIEDAPETRQALVRELLAGYATCLELLKKSRIDEGQQIRVVVGNQVSEIESLTAKAKSAAETVPAAVQARLQNQLSDLITDKLPDERIAQEVALLATKADVREEIDRLEAHIDTAKALLKEGAAIGRRFDFLSQEFNREANTLCSKAQSIELKQVGLDLKTAIDQLREQIQNIE